MSLDLRDLATAITAAVAVYGAGLATYTAMTARRTTRRILRARLTLNVLGDTPEPRTVFLLSAANAGQRVVKVQSACITFPDGRQYLPLEPQLGNCLCAGVSQHGLGWHRRSRRRRSPTISASVESESPPTGALDADNRLPGLERLVPGAKVRAACVSADDGRLHTPERRREPVEGKKSALDEHASKRGRISNAPIDA